MVSWTLVTALSAVGIIGTGIDPRAGILIQEFQRTGKTHYLVGNVSAKNVKISVVAFDETWRIGKPIGKVLAGPWEITANSSGEFDASSLVGETLVRFFLEDNTPLGVLHAPERTKSPGLNGLGSGIEGVSLEVPDVVKPGEIFKVRMRLSAEAVSKVKFGPTQVPAGTTAVELLPEKAESKTLKYSLDAAAGISHLAMPLKATGEHLVELTFRVPEKNPPPMVSFNAWFANHMGGGVTVARGLKVTR